MIFLLLTHIPPPDLFEYLYTMQTHRKMTKDQTAASMSPSSDAEALVAVEPRPYGTFNTV